MKPIFGLPFSVSILFWSTVGLVRLIVEKLHSKLKTRANVLNQMKPSDVAVIIPAHNEGLVIRNSVQALKKLVDKKQIYVASDGSDDKTYRRARMEECHVSYLNPGRGKARALVYLLRRFRLFKRYKLIFIVDADTLVDPTFLERALPLLNDLDTGVVFATDRITWPKHVIPRLGLYFVAYRERLSRMLQYFLIYGQTWKYTNVNYVIPGFAALYRSKVLKQLEIDTPGLLIEDFNLGFQFHKKKLGKIGYSPSLIGWEQHPDNLREYWNQVRRWNIGFFQTVRKNGVWPSFFWLALGVFSFEVILNAIFILILPVLLLFVLITGFSFSTELLGNLSSFYEKFGFRQDLSLIDIFFGVFLIDYIITVVIGLVNKKPQFIFYGLFFFFMHYVTALILVSSIIPGFFGSSSGRWTPPTRRVTS